MSKFAGDIWWTWGGRMNSYLVSVGEEAVPHAINVLNQYGDVGRITADLFAIRSAENADQIRSKLIEAFPTLSHVVVASVDYCSYKGPGNVAFAASILKKS